MGPSGKLYSGKKEQNRTVRSLRTFFLEPKSSQVPPVSIQATKAGDQHGSAKTLAKVKHKKEMHRTWNQGQVSWEKREVLSGCVETGLGKLRYNWS